MKKTIPFLLLTILLLSSTSFGTVPTASGTHPTPSRPSIKARLASHFHHRSQAAKSVAGRSAGATATAAQKSQKKATEATK